LIIVVLNDQQFAGLCRAMDLEHLIDHPDYGDNLKRARRSQELYTLIEGILSTRPREQWLEILERHDVPAAPVLERAEVFQHPQMVANEMFAVQTHPQAGQVEMFNIPIRLSETPGSLRRPAPLLSQHTDEVLQELGYDASRISQLRARKIIG
jgi:CoA:oxalate CoA-transferase